ncbi:hypothetical protein ACHAXT_001462 [Thalassiosira profunda]
MSSSQMHEFSRLISSWSKLKTPRRQEKILAAEMAEQCLREVIEEKEAGNGEANKVLTADVYYLVIQAWLKIGGYKELVHANSLLDLMERVHASKEEGTENFVKASMKCYAAVLDAWCKSRSNGVEVRAEEVLRRMETVGQSIGVDGRNAKHFNNVMNRIATSHKPTVGKEAERLLEEMIASYKEGSHPNGTLAESAIAPNRNSFNTVIKAYANGGGRDSTKNARRVLKSMEDPSSVGLEGLASEIMPDKISYTSILTSLANRNEGSGNENDGGERAEEMLERMVEMYHAGNRRVRPDTVTYNAVLKVYGKSGHPDAGKRSEALLDRMLQLYKGGDRDVLPDDVTFNTVVNNIANSNAADSPQRAMKLLKRMEELYTAGVIDAEPDIITYNSVLNAFAKSGGPDSARQAEKMLESLERAYAAGERSIRPDVYTYNIVIASHANCGNANRAVALLDKMTAKSNKGRTDLKPDGTTYNSVLHAWSRSSDRNAPVKALGLLEIMLRLHEGGDRGADPNARSFSTVITAFSKSKFPRKAKQTRDLLQRMKRLYEGGQRNMRPNIYVYAAVLNACAYTFGRSEEKEEALKIGLETYEEMQASPDIEANHVAYGSYLRVCRRLMPEDDPRRKDLISQAFRQCCSDGQLGEYVLKQLRAVPDLYVPLLQAYIIDGEVSYRDLPHSWTCSVQEKKGRRGAKQSGRKRGVR